MSAADRARLVRRLNACAAARRDYRLMLGGWPISFSALDDEALLDIARQERSSRRLRDQNRRIAA